VLEALKEAGLEAASNAASVETEHSVHDQDSSLVA